MAFRFNSSSPSIASNTLSANHSVRSSFLSILKYSANCITCAHLAYLSPRSILLNIGVSISSKAANCLCSTPCSSLNSFILSPNNMVSILLSSACVSSKFDGFKHFRRNGLYLFVEIRRIDYNINQFRPSVLINSSVFITFNISPRLRSFCSSVLLLGITSLMYS